MALLKALIGRPVAKFFALLALFVGMSVVVVVSDVMLKGQGVPPARRRVQRAENANLFGGLGFTLLVLWGALRTVRRVQAVVAGEAATAPPPLPRRLPPPMPSATITRTTRLTGRKMAWGGDRPFPPRDIPR
jgi:hypothetical protein